MEAAPAVVGTGPGAGVSVLQESIGQRLQKRRHAQVSMSACPAAFRSPHSSHPPHPAASRCDHRPNVPSHPDGRHHPDDRCCGALVLLRKHRRQADVRCPATGQAFGPEDQDCAAGVVDVNPCTDVTDVCAATNAPAADQSERSRHHQPPTPRETPPSRSAHLRRCFVAKQTTGIPATPVMPIAAQSTGGLTHPAAIGGSLAAARTDRNPARRALRNGEAMANTDFEP